MADLTVCDLHDMAMEFSDCAEIAKRQRRAAVALAYAHHALDYERRAVALVPNSEASEPTRSILYLSAASLAYQAGENAAAEQLIAEGLAGWPSPRVREDLENLRADHCQEG